MRNILFVIIAGLCSCDQLALSPLVVDSVPTHPFLFFKEQDLSALREKVEAEPAASMYAKLIDRADGLLKTGAGSVKFKSAIDARVFSTQVIEAAFASYMTGREDYMSSAISQLCAVAEKYTPDDYYQMNNDLFVGNVTEAFAIGYDLVQPFLSPEQDTLLRNEVEELGAYIYSASTTGKTEGSDVYHWIGEDREARYASNWNTVTHANMGLCALVLDAHPEWVERASQRILGYLEVSNDVTGAPYEGASYLGYGKQNAMNYIVALEHCREVDLLASDEASHLPQITQWLVQNLYPWGDGVVPINQSDGLLSQSDWYLLLCRRYQDRVGQWAWLRLFGDPEVYGGTGTYAGSGHPGYSSRMMQSILWVDNDLQPLSPADAGWKMSRLFERGQMAARSGWGDDDSLFTLTSGRGIGGVWNHADENSFTFYACGEAFAIDPGVNRKTSDLHNTILVDGQGQDGNGGPSATQGLITCFEDLGDTVEATGQALTAYQTAGLSNAVRQILYTRSAETPELLICDQYVKKRNVSGSFRWLMYSGAGNRIVIADDKRSAVIYGANGQGLCAAALLAPDDAVFASDRKLKERAGFPLLSAESSKGNFEVRLSARFIEEDQ